MFLIIIIGSIPSRKIWSTCGCLFFRYIHPSIYLSHLSTINSSIIYHPSSPIIHPYIHSIYLPLSQLSIPISLSLSLYIGVLLAEIFGNHPYAHVTYQWNFEFLRQLKNKEITPVFPSSPKECSEEMVMLMKECMDWEESQRPTFATIYSLLKRYSSHY